MRKIIWILCAVLLLSACSSNGNYPDLPESTDITEVTAATDATDATDVTDVIDLSDLPVVTLNVFYDDRPYADSILYTQLWQVSADDQMDHPILQREVKKIPISYPITTQEQINLYANELYRICVSLNLLDTELIPGNVLCYNDGIIVIMFCPAGMHDALAYDGVSADALISAEDGHVIYFGVSEAWE